LYGWGGQLYGNPFDANGDNVSNGIVTLLASGAHKNGSYTFADVGSLTVPNWGASAGTQGYTAPFRVVLHYAISDGFVYKSI